MYIYASSSLIPRNPIRVLGRINKFCKEASQELRDIPRSQRQLFQSKKSYEFLRNMDFKKENSPLYEEVVKYSPSSKISNSSVNQAFLYGDEYRIFYGSPDVKCDKILVFRFS